MDSTRERQIRSIREAPKRRKPKALPKSAPPRAEPLRVGPLAARGPLGAREGGRGADAREALVKRVRSYLDVGGG